MVYLVRMDASGNIEKYKAEIFLSPDGFVPLSLKIPVIPVIHDINFHHRPMDLPLTSRLYYRYFFPKFASRAARIATVSEYSRQDISKSYNINPSKIEVVYNGSHELYKPSDPEIKKSVKDRYTDGVNYFLFVGSLHPRKNVDGLLKAFDIFKKQSQSDFRLLIVGEKFFKNSALEQTYSLMHYRTDVIFTGRKEPQELSLIMAAAWALAFVPHFEGFGIPLLEAMHCDVPSVASNVTSLPEVAGDTAVYVNPDDIHDIAGGLSRMSSDFQLRESLIANCRNQREKFSWNKTAEKLWNTVQSAME
ncbi:MAG: glycosyltransferase family 4 protein [Bacteroidales bacterium]|nr:glycosyltransferase family 4 protein [Bacteroidales bacterium]